MTDPVMQSVSTLMIDTTTNVAVKNITLSIPVQVMTLKSYRVEFTPTTYVAPPTAPNIPVALGKKVIYLSLGASYFDSNNMLDGNEGRVYFPILIGANDVTLETSCDIPINLSRTLPERFTVSLYDSAFNPLGGLVSFHAIFKLDLGHSF